MTNVAIMRIMSTVAF